MRGQSGDAVKSRIEHKGKNRELVEVGGRRAKETVSEEQRKVFCGLAVRSEGLPKGARSAKLVNTVVQKARASDGENSEGNSQRGSEKWTKKVPFEGVRTRLCS